MLWLVSVHNKKTDYYSSNQHDWTPRIVDFSIHHSIASLSSQGSILSHHPGVVCTPSEKRQGQVLTRFLWLRDKEEEWGMRRRVERTMKGQVPGLHAEKLFSDANRVKGLLKGLKYWSHAELQHHSSQPLHTLPPVLPGTPLPCFVLNGFLLSVRHHWPFATPFMWHWGVNHSEEETCM